MATRIIEFGGHGLLGDDFPVVPWDQLVTEQSAMTATGSSQQSAALNAATSLVLVQSDEAINAKYDPQAPTNPVATANSYKIAAGGEQFFSVKPGIGAKIAIK